MPPQHQITMDDIRMIVAYVRELQEANGIKFEKHVMWRLRAGPFLKQASPFMSYIITDDNFVLRLFAKPNTTERAIFNDQSVI